jgi:hypothetical protein
MILSQQHYSLRARSHRARGFEHPADGGIKIQGKGTRLLNLGILAALTLIAWKTSSGWLEIAADLTGLWCVWLTAKESLWNFPISIANEVLFFMLFWQAKLYADATLQVFFRRPHRLGLVRVGLQARGGAGQAHRTVGPPRGSPVGGYHRCRVRPN